MSAAPERRLPLRLSADELQLQKVVRNFLTSVVPAPTGDKPSWADLDPDGRIARRIGSELGLQGLAVAEDFGGQGFGMAELAIIFAELGRVTCAAPLFGTVALAARLLHHLPAGEHRDRLLGEIAEAATRATVVAAGITADGGTLTGAADAVVDAPGANVFLVIPGDDVYAVAADTAGVSVERQDGMDLTRELGRVTLDAAPGTLLAGNAAQAIERATAEATVLLAAELTGVAEAALTEAVAYSTLRTQFGRQIGSFQALKHRMADMLVANEGAWSTTRHAALLCDVFGSADMSDSADAVVGDELRLAAGVAKSAASDAATFATAENIQIHGGIGFTFEHPAHLRFRRARSAAVLLGTAAQHRARVATVLTVAPAGEEPDGPA